MINLLPTASKELLVREHRYAVSAVAALLAALIIVFFIVMAIPSYIILSFDPLLSGGVVKMTQAKKSSSARERISLANENMALLALAPATALPTTILGRLEKAKQSSAPVLGSISLTQLSYEQKERTVSVSINGVARDRETLRQYIATLETTEGVSAVEAPLSNFIASTQIPFTLKVHFASHN